MRADIEKLRRAPTPAVQPVESSKNPDEDASRSASEWDVFISHASEDKDDFVRPLANTLRRLGLSVWFDELTLTVGDSLRRSIDRGLSKSRFGIVVISPSFMEKDWPQKELDGLVAREVEGVKVILPVWHNISADEIRRYSPMLADRLAAQSSQGIDRVASQLIQAIRNDSATRFPIVATLPTTTTSGLRELSQHASEFHSRQTELICSGKASIAILNGGAFILHVFPQTAVGDQPSPSFERVAREPHYFPPIGSTHGRDFKITYDGLIIGSHADGLTKPQRAYVHVFRSGAIEAVASSLARGDRHDFVVLPEIQAMLIKFAYLYMRSLHHFGVEPPMAINLSLINVDGMKLTQDFLGGDWANGVPAGDLNRPVLRFGQAIFEAMSDYNETAKLLKPILAHLANAAGLHSPPYFDVNGNYLGNLR